MCSEPLLAKNKMRWQSQENEHPTWCDTSMLKSGLEQSIFRMQDIKILEFWIWISKFAICVVVRTYFILFL